MLIFLRRSKKLYIVRSPVVQSRFALLISCNDSLTKVVWPLQQGVKNKTDLVRRAAVFYCLQPIRARKLGLSIFWLATLQDISVNPWALWRIQATSFATKAGQGHLICCAVHTLQVGLITAELAVPKAK